MTLAARLLLPIALFGCRSQESSQEKAARDETPAEPVRTDNVEAPAAKARSAAYDLTRDLSSCQIHHRGLSIDVGTRSANLRRTYAVGPFEDAQESERAGATFARLHARKISYDFWLEQPEEEVAVSARVFGGTSGSVTLEVDGKRIGTAKLARGEIRIVNFPALRSALGPGRHVLTLRFSGRVAPAQPFAELDWIRLSVRDELGDTYAAPTLEDVVRDVVIDGQPKRSVALRAPSTVRCALEPASDAVLRVMLGFWGEGEGVAQIRLVRDGEEPISLMQRTVQGGAGAAWTPVEIELGKYADQVAALELRVDSGTRGGRVVFGEPTVLRKDRKAEQVPPAKNVIVIALAGLDRRRVPPWGPTQGLSAFGELSRSGAAFSAYRVPTTVPAGVMASLITGLMPRSHTVEDQAARLPSTVRTLNRLLKEASGRTAMFTGVPTTFRAFGFDAGWDRYEMSSPVKDVPAHQPITQATNWLEHELRDATGDVRRFVLIHARGGHPPWDLSREEVALLKPEEYGGVLDARRGAIVLAGLRSRSHRVDRRLSDEDWARLRALQDAALLKQNAQLAQLLSALKRLGTWDDTMVVLMGDVGMSNPPEIPFEPAAALSEDHLLVPLLVKFPGNGFAGKELTVPTTTFDVARTILQAFRLKAPEWQLGFDLHELAFGSTPIVGRPLMATLGPAFATRIGRYMLQGTLGKAPILCQLDIDPSCVNDVLAERPIAGSALWRWTYETEEAARTLRRGDREAASIDPDTAAALTVWGDIQ